MGYSPPASESPSLPAVGSPSPIQRSPWSANHIPKTIVKPVFDLDNSVARVSVPDEIVDEGSPLWKSFVVGYFMGDAPFVGRIHATVNRIWTSASRPSKKMPIPILELGC